MDKYSGDLDIKIRQVIFDGEFSHWEWESSIGGEVVSEGTAPTFFGCADEVFEMFFEDVDYKPEDIIDMEFFKKDSNNRKGD